MKIRKALTDEALEFLKHERLCVIATASQRGVPESALVAFSENKDLEIMIGTSKDSRKYANIAHNPKVSLVFGFDGENSIQYEGTVRFPSPKETAARLKTHYIKQPGSRKYEKMRDNVYMVIEPSWLRITAAGPTVIGEMRFGDEN